MLTTTAENSRTARLQAEFSKLQQLAQLADRERVSFEISLSVKYGNGNRCYARKAEQAKYDRLVAKYNKLQQKIYDWLLANSPRDWTQGVSCNYVVNCLSFTDAYTTGPITFDTRMPAWGYSESALRGWLAPVRCSPLTGQPYPVCQAVEGCTRTVYEQGLCYGHFQDRGKVQR